MDGHQVAMANNFQPTQIGTLSTGKWVQKTRLGKIYLNPPGKKEPTWYSMEPEKITPEIRKENHLHLTSIILGFHVSLPNCSPQKWEWKFRSYKDKLKVEESSMLHPRKTYMSPKRGHFKKNVL